MNTYLPTVISECSNKGVLLDTNILLLLIVGSLNKDYIAKHKRLSDYCAKDFEALSMIINKFQRIITTPNILTETGNLLKHSHGNNISDLFDMLAMLVAKSEEQYIKSNEIILKKEFSKFGLCDTAALEVAKDGYLFITDDFDLYAKASSKKIKTVNFNQIRGFNLLMS